MGILPMRTTGILPVDSGEHAKQRRGVGVSSDPQRSFFELFGELAVLLSNMEALVASVLNCLINGRNPGVGGLLISDMPLSRKPRHVRALTSIQLCSHKEIQQRLLEIIGQVDELRIERNDFIHGMWCMDDQKLANGRIECFDPRWKVIRTPEGRDWKAFQSREWTFDELRDRKRLVGELVISLAKTVRELRELRGFPN